MKKINKITAMILCISICFSIFAVYSFASSIIDTSVNKLLFIADENNYENIISDLNNPEFIINENEPIEDETIDTTNSIVIDFNKFECISSDEIDYNEVLNYKAIALPYGKAYSSNLAKLAYENGVLVYLYGELSINDYKNEIGIDDFSLAIGTYNSDETCNGNVNQGFDSSFESSELYNVIGYNSNALLCKLNSEIKQANYLVSALKNFEKLNNNSLTRSTIVESKFDFTTYFGANNQVSVHLDYTLYREMDEVDTVYDYFAIKTTTWVDGAGLSNIKTKYSLPKTSDNLLETGPESQNSIGSLSVSVGFGGSLSAEIGYTVDLSDTKPTIERTEDFTNDIVEWELRKRTWFPKNIDGAHLVCLASWASTGKTAEIDVYYQGQVSVGPSSQYISTSEYTCIPISFSYTN